MYDMPLLEIQILRTVITFQKDGKTNFLYIPYVRAYHKVKHLGIAVCYISQPHACLDDKNTGATMLLAESYRSACASIPLPLMKVMKIL